MMQSVWSVDDATICVYYVDVFGWCALYANNNLNNASSYNNHWKPMSILLYQYSVKNYMLIVVSYVGLVFWNAVS